MKKGCKYVTYSLLFILMFCVGIAFHSSLLSELSSKTLQNSLDAIYGNKYKWILNNTYGYRKDVVENARIYGKYKNDIQVLKEIEQLEEIEYINYHVQTDIYFEDIQYDKNHNPEFLYEKQGNLFGISNPNYFDYELDVMDVIDGRVFTKEEMDNGEYVCLVPSVFYHNGNQAVKVGDQITVYTYISEPTDINEIGIDNEGNKYSNGEKVYRNIETYTFTVIGTIDYSKKDFSTMINMLFVPVETAYKIHDKSFDEFSKQIIENKEMSDYASTGGIGRFNTFVVLKDHVDNQVFESKIHEIARTYDSKIEYIQTSKEKYSTLAMEITTCIQNSKWIQKVSLFACFVISMILICFTYKYASIEKGMFYKVIVIGVIAIACTIPFVDSYRDKLMMNIHSSLQTIEPYNIADPTSPEIYIGTEYKKCIESINVISVVKTSAWLIGELVIGIFIVSNIDKMKIRKGNYKK
ncbi:MAG: ABC transporter permease [Erysipelotrichaceae bacterium]|nr:ABC transporter permease [Erysipelotrichaceae bacterium]